VGEREVSSFIDLVCVQRCVDAVVRGCLCGVDVERRRTRHSQHRELNNLVNRHYHPLGSSFRNNAAHSHRRNMPGESTNLAVQTEFNGDVSRMGGIRVVCVYPDSDVLVG